MIYEGKILSFVERELQKREEIKILRVIESMTEQELKEYQKKLLEIINNDKKGYLK